MTRKIFLLENKKKIILIFLILISIIIFISIFVYQKYNYNYFIQKIESSTGLEIKTNNDFSIKLFPKIHFIQNNLKIFKKNNNINLIFRKTNLELIKEYFDWNTTIINIKSPSAVFNGISLRNIIINTNYQDKKVDIKKFSSDINNGRLNFLGEIIAGKEFNIKIDGNFENLSLTDILNQLQLIQWKRLNIKLRSKNFSIKSHGTNNDKLIKNLSANFPIQGLFYINATPEERFGTALLNVLTKKIPDLKNLSSALDFIFSKYADVPSQIKGSVKIKNGKIQTDEIVIYNEAAKMDVDLTYDYNNDELDGTLSFYNEEKIALQAKVKGNISSPQILIGSKTLVIGEDKEPLEDIKKVIEEGITNIFQKLLDNN